MVMKQTDNRPNGKPSKKVRKKRKESEEKEKSKMSAAASKSLSKMRMPVESILGRQSKKSLRKPGGFTGKG